MAEHAPTFRRVIAVSLAAAAFACDGTSPVSSPTELSLGTWGGQDAGVVVTDGLTHVHIGCTFGDFPAAIPLNEASRFSVPGEYQLRAYPVVKDPPMPARFAGVVRGSELMLTVAVNDTIENALVVLGPITVRYGQEPEMAICPICALSSPPALPPAPGG